MLSRVKIGQIRDFLRILKWQVTHSQSKHAAICAITLNVVNRLGSVRETMNEYAHLLVVSQNDSHRNGRALSLLVMTSLTWASIRC